MSLPQATKHHPIPNQGRDYLGQQSIIQAMADTCLPGFTNGTRIMRYYPFWAWAFYQVINNSPPDNEIWNYLLKLETALILANRLRNPKMTGMPGVSAMRYSPEKILSMSDNEYLDLTTESRATAYSPVQYSPSLASLGIVTRDGTQCELLEYGYEMALAFDKGFEDKGAYRELVDVESHHVTVSALKRLKTPLSLELPRSEEIEVFGRAVFGVHGNSMSPQQRRRTTALIVLTIVDHFGGMSVDQFKQELWLGTEPHDPDAADLRTAWRFVEARRLYQYFIETILAAFSRYLGETPDVPRRFSEFVDRVLDGPRPATAPDVDPSTNSFNNYRTAVMSRNRANALTEWDAMDRIRADLRNRTELSIPVYEACNGILLLISSLPSLDAPTQAISKEFYRGPAGYRHSFATCQRLLDSWSSLTGSEALARMIVELSLKLHLGVAQDRWYTTGNFNYRFIVGADGGYKLLEPKDDPVMTENKIVAFLDIMVGIALLQQTDQVYTITEEGREFTRDTLTR